MKIQVHTGICLALLASATLLVANAQTSNGSPQNNGSKQSTGTSETNGATGQRKDGQVVHQDFGHVQASKPKSGAAIAPSPNEGETQGSAGNSATNSKIKVRQEFGPSQTNKKDDVIVPGGTGGQGGKPKTTDAKTQSPK
jgi:hypothetical protein